MQTDKPPRIFDAAYALEDRPEPDQIVEGLIPTHSVCLFHGEGGKGKTYVGITLGVCVAAGMDCMELKTRQRAVLFIDEESGSVRFSRRFAEVLRGENLGPETPFYYTSMAGFMFDDRKSANMLHLLIEQYQIGLVIIDPLVNVMSGDENSVQDVRKLFDNLRSIADTTGVAIILIHHSNRAGAYRGSSAIKGALETMVLLTKAENENVIHFKTEKNRDYESGAEWSAIATWKKEEGTFTLRKSNSLPREYLPNSQEYVLRYLRENGQNTITAIKGAADTCSARSAENAIHALARAGLIYRVNPSGNPRTEAIYALKEERDDE